MPLSKKLVEKNVNRLMEEIRKDRRYLKIEEDGLKNFVTQIFESSAQADSFDFFKNNKPEIERLIDNIFLVRPETNGLEKIYAVHVSLFGNQVISQQKQRPEAIKLQAQQHLPEQGSRKEPMSPREELAHQIKDYDELFINALIKCDWDMSRAKTMADENIKTIYPAFDLEALKTRGVNPISPPAQALDSSRHPPAQQKITPVLTTRSIDEPRPPSGAAPAAPKRVAIPESLEARADNQRHSELNNINRECLGKILQKSFSDAEILTIGYAPDLLNGVVKHLTEMGIDCKAAGDAFNEYIALLILDNRGFIDVDKKVQEIITEGLYFFPSSQIPVKEQPKLAENQLTKEQNEALDMAIALVMSRYSNLDQSAITDYFTACIKDPQMLHQALESEDPQQPLVRELYTVMLQDNLLEDEEGYEPPYFNP